MFGAHVQILREDEAAFVLPHSEGYARPDTGQAARGVLVEGSG